MKPVPAIAESLGRWDLWGAHFMLRNPDSDSSAGRVVDWSDLNSMDKPRVQKTIRSKTGVRKLYKEFRAAHGGEAEIAFYLQDWDDPYNVGGLFRVADAVGATELFLSGKTPAPPDPQVHVTSLGHHRRIPFTQFEKHEEAALAIKAAGYALIAVELADGAECYTEFDWPSRVCLVLGNEVHGTYGAVMKHRDGAVYIPQFGKGRSMNVHVTAAIVAFHVRMRG